MSELKPCPFCGGIGAYQRDFHMCCQVCGAEGPDGDSSHESAAIEFWNRRAQPAQAGQVLTLDEVREAVHEAGLDWHNGWTIGDDAENRYLNLCRAIEQAVLAKRVPQWLPIDTAPKDGTNVLCWSAEFGARESRNITYAPGSPGHAEGNTDRWWEWLEPKKGWAFNWSPTHWMPLPPPPGIVGEKGGA